MRQQAEKQTSRRFASRGIPRTAAPPSLGATRPTVTVVAGTLQKAGLIKYTHGRITIVDRQNLETAACQCYGTIKAHFNRLGL
jgi:hypothetical protein